MIKIPYAYLDEDFEDYLNRFPTELQHIDKNIVEHWFYHHWRPGFSRWSWIDFTKCNFHKEEFDNRSIMEIFSIIDGSPYDCNVYVANKEKDWLGMCITKYRAFPEPIIVALNAGKYYDPEFFLPSKKNHDILTDGPPQKSEPQKMKEPYHLLEGHRRLFYKNFKPSFNIIQILKL